jgi:hypothetical protein
MLLLTDGTVRVRLLAGDRVDSIAVSGQVEPH